MFYAQAVSGKPFPENMGVQTAYIDIIKSGLKQVSFKGYGNWVWKNTMN